MLNIKALGQYTYKLWPITKFATIIYLFLKGQGHIICMLSMSEISNFLVPLLKMTNVKVGCHFFFLLFTHLHRIEFPTHLNWTSPFLF